MKNKTLGHSILGIAFIFLSVIAFAIPTFKAPSFWIGYIFTAAAFLAQLFIWKVGFKGSATLKSKFLGLPIIYIGLCYLVIQTMAFVMFLIIPSVPIWITILVFVLIVGLSSLFLITTEVGRSEVVRVEEKVHEKINYIQQLQVNVELMAEGCSDDDCKKALFSLVEIIKYSDPMSNEKLHSLETQICEMVSTLKHSAAYSLQQIQDIESAMAERNRKCKLLK